MSIYLKVISENEQSSVPLPSPKISLEISDETVISYSIDGQVASRFGDDIWDFSAISRTNQFINFDSTIFSSSTIKELKLITYARVYWSPSSRSISSIRLKPLLLLAEWASSNKLSISHILNEEKIYSWLASSLSSLERRTADEVAAAVNELSKIRVVNGNFTIAPINFKLANLLRDVSSAIPKKRTKQTAIIPTRLYAEIITSFESFLIDFNDRAQNIKKFFEFTINGLKTGGDLHTTSSGFKRWYKRDNNYKCIIEELNLTELVEKHHLTDKKQWNKYIRDIQQTARFWIHIFTGMRDQEVNTLDRECLSALDIKGTTAKIIQGYTTKTIGSGATSTYWITSDIIDIGIKACHTIGEIAAMQNNWVLHNTEYPLIPVLFPIEKDNANSRLHANAPCGARSSGRERTIEWLSRFPALVVTESDLAELYAFDGFRNWSEDIKIGEVWPLATHQCRRSLAVYLARSGMVSIGSLQLQFKHLLAAMTSFYRKNSSFAKNFIFNDEQDEYHQSQINFIEAIETEQRVSQFLNYEEKVLGNQNQLWGGEGTRIRRANEIGKPIILLSDRSRLKKSFMDGEMHYKSGPIGGCTNVGPCEKVSITQIGRPCMSCADFIGDNSSIFAAEKALKTLCKTRDKYPTSSLHYRQAQADIDDFESKLKKVREASVE